MGALKGITIIELAGIGPAPFAAMLLADHGARVIRVERPGGRGLRPGNPERDLMSRGRRSLFLDLKSESGCAALLRLIAQADGLIEGFRPGVMERLGLGPDICLSHNPRLVYGRMTGWGQSGPLADRAGHDINYIALSGALAAIGGPDGKPAIPLNLIGDFGGGALYLAFGMLCALLLSHKTGTGQVVDAAMVDGVSSLMTVIHSLDGIGLWQPQRNRNLLDGGAPFYDSYETRDGRYMALGALEPQFFQLFLEQAGLQNHPACQNQYDVTTWPAMRSAIGDRIKEKTSDEWQQITDGTDACLTVVLDYHEARKDAHLKARGTFQIMNGVEQPAPAPRLSKTPGTLTRPPPIPGEHSAEILAEFGFSEEEIALLVPAAS